jgi:hypothetical protein
MTRERSTVIWNHLEETFRGVGTGGSKGRGARSCGSAFAFGFVSIEGEAEEVGEEVEASVSSNVSLVN